MNYQVNWFSYGADSSALKSSDFGLIITANNTYDAPQRSVTAYQVQGRNGDVVVDNGRWNNVTISYTVHALRTTTETMNRIRAWLCVPTGYQRIFDSYDSTIFREGYFSGNIAWTMTQLQKHGSATITFTCKPQRFIKSTAYGESTGETISTNSGQWTSITMASDVLPSYPLFKGVLSSETSCIVELYILHGSDEFLLKRSYDGPSSTDVVTIDLQNLTLEVVGTATASGNLYIMKYDSAQQDFDTYTGEIKFEAGETYQLLMYAGDGTNNKMWRRTSII